MTLSPTRPCRRIDGSTRSVAGARFTEQPIGPHAAKLLRVEFQYVPGACPGNGP